MTTTFDPQLASVLGTVELHALGTGSSLITISNGDQFQVGLPASEVGDVFAACASGRQIDSLLSDPAVSRYRALLDLLVNNDVLRPAPAASESTEILLIGDSAMCTALAQHLPTWNCRVKAGTSVATTAYLDAGTVVIWASSRSDAAVGLELNARFAESGTRWIPVELRNCRLYVGPTIKPGRACDYDDLTLRRRAAARDVDLYEATSNPPVFTTLPRMTAELDWALGAAAAGIEQWLTERPTVVGHGVLDVDLIRLTTCLHPLLPLPHKTVERPQRMPMALVDSEQGIVLRTRPIVHSRSVPTSLTTVQSDVACMERIYPWPNNTTCQGSTFGAPAEARDAAIGEAVERYCANLLETLPRIFTSYDELTKSGEYALDPSRLVLFSERQYDAPGFPCQRFTRDLKVSWIPGQSLTNGRPIYVPASLVYVNYRSGAQITDPVTNGAMYPGIAAGPSRDFAIVSGLEEIVERHATMIWWHNRHPLPRVALTDELAAVWAGAPTSLGQRASLVHLDNEFDIPVMAGILENTAEQLLNIGFAARPGPTAAAFKAWTEALTLQEGSRDMLDSNGAFRQAIARHELSGQSIKEHREDRGYLESYRTDFRDVNDLMCQQQIHLDPRSRDRVAAWIDTPVTRRIDQLPSLPDRELTTYKDRIEDRGYEIIYVDITSPDVASAGLRVVRTIVPGLIPNFPAAFPYLGNHRLQAAPVELGWTSQPLDENEINYFPLPHA